MCEAAAVILTQDAEGRVSWDEPLPRAIQMSDVVFRELMAQRNAVHVRVHIETGHPGLLPLAFTPRPGVSWDAVHHLLHRLQKWGKPWVTS